MICIESRRSKMIKVEGSKMTQLTILDPLLGGLQVQPFQALSA